MKSHFGMSVLLYICCILSEYLFFRNTSGLLLLVKVSIGNKFYKQNRSHGMQLMSMSFSTFVYDLYYLKKVNFAFKEL